MRARLNARNAGQSLSRTPCLYDNHAPGLGAIFIASPADIAEDLTLLEAVGGVYEPRFRRSVW